MKKLNSFLHKRSQNAKKHATGHQRQLTHTCHLSKHPKYPARAPVRNVNWKVPEPNYAPVEFTHQSVYDNDSTKKKEGGWADPEFSKKFQEEVLKTRTSNALELGGSLVFDPTSGRPLNPAGRTGISGRGLLGKWGPNQAADPIVTRFHPETGVLQVALIQREDVGTWAIPGGMVDDGELISQTLKREFLEEAAKDPDKERQGELKEKLDDLFASVSNDDDFVYIGYVDDPRNTDNAWMETVAVHYHISDPTLASGLELSGRDDAVNSRWINVDDAAPEFKALYANHRLFVYLALAKNDEAWHSTLSKIILSDEEDKLAKQMAATVTISPDSPDVRGGSTLGTTTDSPAVISRKIMAASFNKPSE